MSEMKLKRLFYDCETTGLWPNKHSIRQHAGIIEIDGKVVEKFNIHCLPQPGTETDPKALEATGLPANYFDITEDLMEGDAAIMHVKSILAKYVDRYNPKDKFFFCAYNAQFDDGHLRATWKRAGLKFFGSYFHWPVIDVAQTASEYLALSRNHLPNFKLGTVAGKILNLKEDYDWHDGMADISATRDLYHFIKGKSV